MIPHQPGSPNFNPYTPPAYGPQQHGPAAGYGPPYGMPQQASSKATTALVLAILSWAACGCFTSLPGFFMARAELQAIDRGESSPAGRGLAQAAFWISVVNLVLYVLVLVYVFVMFVVVGAGGYR